MESTASDSIFPEEFDIVSSTSKQEIEALEVLIQGLSLIPSERKNRSRRHASHEVQDFPHLNELQRRMDQLKEHGNSREHSVSPAHKMQNEEMEETCVDYTNHLKTSSVSRRRQAQRRASFDQGNHASVPDFFSRPTDRFSDIFSPSHRRAQRRRSDGDEISGMSIPIQFRVQRRKTRPLESEISSPKQCRAQRRRSNDQGNHASASELSSQEPETIRCISTPTQFRVDRRRSLDNASVAQGSGEDNDVRRLMKGRAQSMGSYNQNNHASSPELFSHKSASVDDIASLTNARSQRRRSSEDGNHASTREIHKQRPNAMTGVISKSTVRTRQGKDSKIKARSAGPKHSKALAQGSLCIQVQDIAQEQNLLEN